MEMVNQLGLLVVLVYTIVELLEKLGLHRKFAHLTAIPLGFLSSFSLLQCTSISEYLIKGLVIGLVAVGTCDSACNVIETLQEVIKRI